MIDRDGPRSRQDRGSLLSPRLTTAAGTATRGSQGSRVESHRSIAPGERHGCAVRYFDLLRCFQRGCSLSTSSALKVGGDAETMSQSTRGVFSTVNVFVLAPIEVQPRSRGEPSWRLVTTATASGGRVPLPTATAIGASTESRHRCTPARPSPAPTPAPAVHPDRADHPAPAVHPDRADHPAPAVHPDRADHPAPAVHPDRADHPAPAVHPDRADHPAPARRRPRRARVSRKTAPRMLSCSRAGKQPKL